MTKKIEIDEPLADAPREVWRKHLYRLMDLMVEHPGSVEVVEAIMRANDALQRLDYPDGFGRKERLAERIQDARYAAGIDVPGKN
ncbi:MAG: hypothetical protein KDJ37_08685 [Hyphomicrobiaceae bacterium]|nr:hypothetical protein [Hyphomicrobiaceae bacterium]